MTPTADPAAVPGLPESALRPEHLAALPAEGPAAPWECRARAVVWVQRGRPPAFGWHGRPLPLAIAGFVEYLDSPVGPYHEVLAATLVRTGRIPVAQVPFIAVDSLPSVLGGRINWGLPKTMARFETDLGTATARVDGDDWSVAVRPVRDLAQGPDRPDRPDRPALSALSAGRSRLPIRSRFSVAGPLGTYRGSLHGHGRLVRVRTEATGSTLSGWLGGGTHLAVQLTGTFRIQAPG